MAPLIDLKALSDAYAVFVVDASHKMRNGNFTWEEGAASLADAVKNINRAWSALTQAELPPSVQQAFAEARERRAPAEQVTQDLVCIAAAKNSAPLDQLVKERLYQAIDPFTESIGGMMDTIVAETNDKFANEMTSVTQATLIITLMGLFSLAALIAAGWVVVARVTRPLGTLANGMENMSKGNLSKRFQGKGFAVVASEVKNLAAQSAKATESIQTEIGAMQNIIGDVVGVIEDIVKRISQLDGENTAIAAAVEEQSATTAEIASSLRNAAQAVDGLEGSIGRVSGMAEDAGKAMGSITQASRTVADEAVQLREATQALIKRLQAA